MASKEIIRDLYGGRIHVVHNPDARGRQPRYLINGEIKPKGVTTIMGQTLFKNLMQWAVDSCVNFLRDKLPVITEEDLLAGAKAHTTLRDKGASTGSEAHAMVEQFLKDEQVQKGSKEATAAYLAFVKWFEEKQPEILGVEEVIYSEKYNYAGTYDCMLRIDGVTYLCDLKTTNPSRDAPKGVYAENFIQLGAYALAHTEQRETDTDLAEINDLMVISAKKNGVLDIVTASDLELTVDDCSRTFKLVLGLYGFMQATTNKLKGK